MNLAIAYPSRLQRPTRACAADLAEQAATVFFAL